MSGARTTTAGSTGVLLGLAILLAGVAAWPWLAADEAVTVAPPVGPVSPALPSAADPRALSTVLERPLFAPGRRPVAAEGSAPPASAPRTALRVEGVVDAGGRRRVILRRDQPTACAPAAVASRRCRRTGRATRQRRSLRPTNPPIAISPAPIQIHGTSGFQ